MISAEEDNVVEHPSHYTQGSIEVLDFIIDQKFGYLDGNVVKYMCRYRYKGGAEDLRKARQYLNLLIKLTENVVDNDK